MFSFTPLSFEGRVIRCSVLLKPSHPTSCFFFFFTFTVLWGILWSIFFSFSYPLLYISLSTGKLCTKGSIGFVNCVHFCFKGIFLKELWRGGVKLGFWKWIPLSNKRMKTLWKSGRNGEQCLCLKRPLKPLSLECWNIFLVCLWRREREDVVDVVSLASICSMCAKQRSLIRENEPFDYSRFIINVLCRVLAAWCSRGEIY